MRVSARAIRRVGLRRLARLVVHMRVVLVNGNVAMHNGEMEEWFGFGADYAHHGAQIAEALRMRGGGWDQFEERYVSPQARRLWVRVLLHNGIGPDPDATVTDLHPGDAASAPERADLAAVRQFPRKPRRDSENGGLA